MGDLVEMGVGHLWSVGQIGLLPVTVGQAVLAHSMATDLGIGCGCFPTVKAELSSCNRDRKARKAQNICYLILC